MTQKSKNITLALATLVIVVAAGVGYAYMKQNQNSSKLTTNQPQWITAKSGSFPGLFPPGMPYFKGSKVLTSRYYVDSNSVHGEYAYSRPNSTTGTTIQDNFVKDLNFGGWQNIQSTKDHITASKGKYSLSVDFSPVDVNTTKINIQYTHEN